MTTHTPWVSIADYQDVVCVVNSPEVFVQHLGNSVELAWQMLTVQC